ncbi:MAG TPA: hypothetical protein VNA28_08630 [Solirubrobacteraceae bacterium]|nr:hypothetical protein [Solirubrobacteraceae bacterium]
MARLARLASLATLLLAAAALAACGDDNSERNRYIDELTSAQLRFQSTQERFEADATKSSTGRQNSRALTRFATAIAETVAALRRIDAPRQVAAEHRRFVGVFETWHDDVARFAAAIRNPTPRAFARARRRITAATDTFNRSSRDAATRIDAELERH